MLYSVTVVSSAHQCESVIIIYIYILSLVSLTPPKQLFSIEFLSYDRYWEYKTLISKSTAFELSREQALINHTNKYLIIN